MSVTIGKTTIEWADSSTTPVIGCDKVSAGCRLCYAATLAGSLATRFRSGAGARYLPVVDGRGGWSGKVVVDRAYMARTTVPQRAHEPDGSWRPARIFDVSMGDLFHEALTDDEIAEVFWWMSRARETRSGGTCRGPTRIVVTKRPERAADLLPRLHRAVHPWPVLHLLATVERQDYAAPRLDPLMSLTRGPGGDVALVGVSAEPLLGPLDLGPWIGSLGWVIVGGESGRGAMPMHLAWCEGLVAQCRAAGVPVFVKQLGARPVLGRGAQTLERERERWPGHAEPYLRPIVLDERTTEVTAWLRKKGGDPAEWPEHLRVREWPAA